jgi:predicted phage terminase large subunit-like protein
MYSDKEIAEASLYEFFKQAWHVIEASTEFVDEWCIKEICNSLEDCYYRKIKLLLINLPPKLGKTNLISIVFPVWVWVQDAEQKFICASYTNTLALRFSDKSRLLIESDWFKKNWGDRFKLRKDQNSKSYFVNNKTGCRISTSTGSFVTGGNADIIIVDDPNDPSGESEIKTKKVNIWWTQKLYSRVASPITAVRIVVQQRSQDVNDVSGNIIRDDTDNKWVKYILPMEYEQGVKSNFKDKRTVEGELLTSRHNLETIKELKKTMGSYGYAAQYQQRPSPAEGGMIKKKWFKLYKFEQLPQIQFVIQSWDTALTAHDDSNYSACTTWGIFSDRQDNENVILLSAWRGKLEYPELRDRVKRLAFDYRDTGENVLTRNTLYEPDLILIEAKASGDPLIQDLKRASVYARPFIPNKHGDKIQRVRLVTSLIESGVIWLPCQKNNVEKMADFADEFVTSVSYFPNVSSRDYVDTMTQALIVLRDGNRISHPKDNNNFIEDQDVKRFY